MSYNSIFNFLTEKYSERRKYSMVVGYFCALKIPMLFAKDIQLLRWNLNDLLRFLESETFGPLKEKPFLRIY